MSNLDTPLNLEVGLERVSFKGTSKEALPIQPAGRPVGQTKLQLKLRKILFEPKSQEQVLLQSIRPDVTHREVFVPHVFHAMVDRTIHEFREREKTSDSAEKRRSNRRAARTLESFCSLCSLLRRNQHALHRG